MLIGRVARRNGRWQQVCPIFMHSNCWGVFRKFCDRGLGCCLLIDYYSSEGLGVMMTTRDYMDHTLMALGRSDAAGDFCSGYRGGDAGDRIIAAVCDMSLNALSETYTGAGASAAGCGGGGGTGASVICRFRLNLWMMRRPGSRRIGRLWDARLDTFGCLTCKRKIVLRQRLLARKEMNYES